MLQNQNSTVSSDLAALTHKAGAKIASAIQTASNRTGVDFSYLLQQAQVESSFKEDAKAGTSSASGLYQFIEATWLQMVNKYGDKYGLSDYADKISDNGKVADKALRQKILNLRNDAEICSLMAGELAAENKSYLKNCVGGEIGSTELYMAHFMGPGGAAKFLNALNKNPDGSAADAFPQAAAANKNVFYTKSGKEKSLAEVYAFFDKKFQIEGDASDSCAATTAFQPVLPPALPAMKTDQHSGQMRTSNQGADNVLAALPRRGYGQLYSEARSAFPQHEQESYRTLSPTTGHDKLAALTNNFLSPVDVLDLLRPDEKRAQG